MNATVIARPWAHGWELEIDADHHTQVSTLDKAVSQVRDYLDTEEPDIDHSDWNIAVVPDLGPLGDQVLAARKATEAAAEASRAAAKRSRAAVRLLREAGYSVTDSAVILGVSRGRVSQLAAGVTTAQYVEQHGAPARQAIGNHPRSNEVGMSGPGPSYHVTPHGDGWAAERSGAERASSVHDTQAEAIEAARGYLKSQGGGELNIHGKDGQIRAKDTIAPGDDPRNLPG